MICALYIIVISLSLISVTKCEKSIDGYIYDSETRAFYKAMTEKASWAGAVGACKAEGAVLPTPTTALEAKALIRYMSDGTQYIWIGIHDLFGEGKFITLDGISVTDVYTNWAFTEPNNEGNEDCVTLRSDGEYNDKNCWESVQFICKKNNVLHSYDGPVLPFFRKDYFYNSAFRSFYKHHRTALTWDDASETCVREGAELAAPATEEEKTAIFNLRNSNVMWIGIKFSNTTENFVTSNGTSTQGIFMNWNVGEPNNQGGVEFCVDIENEGFYNDNNCDYLFSFVCKKKLDTLTTSNILCNTHDTGYVYSLETNHCYKYHPTPNTWHEAYRTCFDEGSYLGIINSLDEAQVFLETFYKNPINSVSGRFNNQIIHLGFNDLLTTGTFQTIEGKTLAQSGYSNWATGQPKNAGSNAHCGAMDNTNGKLHATACHIRAVFICERNPTRPLLLDTSLRYGRSDVHLCVNTP